ncbi:hypothetical protein ERN12_15525 [Rhodobacteraceae bacterium]|nr:hypothetical protein ERN12_15525 [Paracoccaceae bacterium]
MGGSFTKGAGIDFETFSVTTLIAAASGVQPSPQDDPWMRLLEGMCKASLAESAVLQLSWPGAPAQGWHAGAPWAGIAEDVIKRMRTGRVYSQADLPGPPPPAPVRALKLALDDGGTALLAQTRSKVDFRAVDGVQMSNLRPYLKTALQCWRARARAQALAQLDRRACQDLGMGWIILSSTGQVLEIDKYLLENLHVRTGMRVTSDRRLSMPGPQAAQRLRHAISNAPHLPQGHAHRVDLSQDPSVQMLVSIEDLGSETAIVGRLRYALSARDLPIARVQQCFGLSHSEARLAVCLCDGLSLKQAAQNLGWTIETTRSCSKQIFARMEQSGQPGVVRHMLESAIWIS